MCSGLNTSFLEPVFPYSIKLSQPIHSTFQGVLKFFNNSGVLLSKHNFFLAGFKILAKSLYDDFGGIHTNNHRRADKYQSEAIPLEKWRRSFRLDLVFNQ